MRPILHSFIALVFFALPGVVFSQILTPATWDIRLSATEVKAGDEIEIIFKATVDDLWYLYATDFDPNCGPLPAELRIDESSNVALVGELKAINPSPKYDENFGCDVKNLQENGRIPPANKSDGKPGFHFRFDRGTGMHRSRRKVHSGGRGFLL